MKIGLTYTGDSRKHGYYQQWLQGSDQIDVIRLDGADEFTGLDGLVLSGGIDIHPDFYGGRYEYPHQPRDGWDRGRDQLEWTAFGLALEKQVPVLGVCRGLQLINVFMNGTLVQDLGDQALNPVHRGYPDKQHRVIVQHGALLQEITGIESGEVNSAHHQSIETLGKGLKVNARSEDGLIEGIEWSDPRKKPFMLAVQWHPERMFVFNLQDSPLSAGIRDRFIGEVHKKMHNNI